jgi:FkbM family methyltransferase
MKLARFLRELIHISRTVPERIVKTFQQSQSDIAYPFCWVPSNIKAKWIIDVGANVGDISLAALRTYPDSRLICFEPVKSQFLQLEKKLLNFRDRTTLYNMGLSDKAGQTDILITSYCGANCLSPLSDFYRNSNPTIEVVGKEQVQLCRLDDISSQFPTQRIDILKIDVEGHELSVLNGGENFIGSLVDTILIEISFQRDYDWENQAFLDIFIKLKDLGFRLINIYDVYNARGDRVSNNMLVTQIDCVFRHKRNLSVT